MHTRLNSAAAQTVKVTNQQEDNEVEDKTVTLYLAACEELSKEYVRTT